MKNTLWFFFPPADEREILIYKKAYERALSVLVLFLGIMLYVSWFVILFIGRNWDNIDMLRNFTLFLGGSLLFAYIAAWTAVRKEDLALVHQAQPKVHHVRYLAAILLLTALCLLYFFSTLYISSISWTGGIIVDIIFIYIVLLHPLLILWAWKCTKPLPFAIRVVASVLFAPGIIPFMYIPWKNIFSLLGMQLITVVMAIAIVWGGIIWPLQHWKFRQVEIQNNEFEPNIMKGEKVWTYRGDSIGVNDIIVYWDLQGVAHAAQLTGITYSTYEIYQPHSNIQQINRQEIWGIAEIVQ